ncbi:metalloendopeptidase activity [Seminavis robusta]|uniref:Metalloendopeptidase activity n=1 Tax=Seminavis robusta TaxID=568900 RepID=A0A9N8H3W5_9STRA|nr:metalloendopeptidase activity [Seminavis robusta]|eukprot:Sro98_g050470.1 metalloendopeptidase activity (368) ;mRNA; f:57597-58810
MLIRNAFSPMMRVAVTGGRPSLLSIRGGLPKNSAWLLHRPNNPALISAAFLTTQSNGSPVHAASSSLRSRRTQPLAPLLPFPHHRAVALFSSSGGAPKGGGRAGLFASVLGAGALIVGKGKYILGALKLTKFASLGSMFVTVGAYTMLFGFPYAVGMVGLIAVHETGHALVMLRYGIPFSPMVFVPFMGAAVAMKDMPKDAMQDAVIAFGGPVLGTVGAMGVAVAAQATDSQLLFALADFGYMINLINMIPIGALDGGKIAGACSPYAGVVGLGMGGGLLYGGVISNPIFYLVMLAGGWSTFQRFYDPKGYAPPNFYKITPTQKAGISAGYVGLVGTIMLAMSANAVNKKSPEEIKRYQELSIDARY